MNSKLKIKIFTGLIILGSTSVSLNSSCLSKTNNYHYAKEIEKTTNDNCNIDEKNIYVYNSNYLKKILNNENISFDDIKKQIKINPNLSNNRKKQITNFIKILIKKYPNIDLLCFYENIKRLSIKSFSSKNLDKSLLGYFDMKNQTIYLRNTINSKKLKNTIFYHELTHLLNNLELKINDYTIHRHFFDCKTNYGKAISEGLDCYLSEQIFYSNQKLYQDELRYASMLYDIYGKKIINYFINKNIYTLKKIINKNTTDKYDILNLIDTSSNNDIVDSSLTKCFFKTIPSGIKKKEVYNEFLSWYLNYFLNDCYNGKMQFTILENYLLERYGKIDKIEKNIKHIVLTK